MKNLTIFTISDGTGETALSIVRAVKVQFEDTDIHIKRFDQVRTRDELARILLDAKDVGAIVVITLVDPNLRLFFISRSMQLNIKIIDLLFPLLETLSERLGMKPNAIPGLLRKLDTGYFKRIEAIEFTVRHDDGLLSADVDQADLVLVGVSRTSKTPLSMYLAHKGYKVANVPLVHGIPLPEKLFSVDQNKIIGLVIDADRLTKIRAARLDFFKEWYSYSCPDKIMEEIEWSLSVFDQHKRWPVIDVTGKALEENAVEIEKIILSRYPHLRDRAEH